MPDYMRPPNTPFEVTFKHLSVTFHRHSIPFRALGISETLHAEISPLGLRSICFDFGYFRTDFLSADHRAPAQARISDYKDMTERADASLNGI
jgi:hypothetical protein